MQNRFQSDHRIRLTTNMNNEINPPSRFASESVSRHVHRLTTRAGFCAALLLTLAALSAALAPAPARAGIIVDNTDGSPAFSTSGIWNSSTTTTGGLPYGGALQGNSIVTERVKVHESQRYQHVPAVTVPPQFKRFLKIVKNYSRNFFLEGVE